MPAMLDTMISAVLAVRGTRPTCLACGRPVSDRDETIRIRGGTVVHRRCATYVARRRRTGSDRLGYPRR